MNVEAVPTEFTESYCEMSITKLGSDCPFVLFDKCSNLTSEVAINRINKQMFLLNESSGRFLLRH
jgi:hypothetical protein